MTREQRILRYLLARVRRELRELEEVEEVEEIERAEAILVLAEIPNVEDFLVIEEALDFLEQFEEV